MTTEYKEYLVKLNPIIVLDPTKPVKQLLLEDDNIPTKKIKTVNFYLVIPCLKY